MKQLEAVAENVLDQFVLELFDPTSKAFLIWVTASIVLGVVSAARVGGGGWLAAWRRAFPRESIVGPSAVLDYKIAAINFVLAPLLAAPTLVVVTLVAGLVSSGLTACLGDGPQLEGSALAMGLMVHVAYFVAADATSWAVHFLSHKYSILWFLHAVHHSAKWMNPATTQREHPLYELLRVPIKAVVYGPTLGAVTWLFVDDPAASFLAGQNAVLMAYHVVGSNLRHSHAPVTWGAPWNRWFISPKDHQAHHSPDLPGVNYGKFLSVWDRLAGTRYYAKPDEEFRFGLDEPEFQHESLSDAFIKPIRQVFAHLRRERS